MNRWYPWLAVAGGIVLVIIVAALIGSRSRETVTAGEWAQNVCGAVGVWRGEVEAIVEDVRTPPARGATGTEEPQSETPQGRTAFVRQGLERGVEATKTLVEGIDRAGVPETANGEEAANVVSDWADSAVDRLEEAQDSLDEEADTLEAAVRQATGAAGAIGATLAGGTKAIVDAARADPELRQALRQSSTCRELPQEATA